MRYAPAADRAAQLVVPLYRGLRAPGMGIAVAVRGRVVWTARCGSVTDRTRFRIGSVSKPLTSLVLARLVRRRVIDLDAPVQRYVPGFPRKREGTITLRLLAGHLAGIRHYETRDEVVNTRHYPSAGAALSIFSHDRLVSPPGAAFNYSSYGWNLLGVALARAAHTSFPALVERELGLHRAFVDSTRYYELADDGRAVPAPRVDLSDRLPSGGFRASAADIARVVSKVAPPHARLLFTPQRTRDGTSTHYGLGWEVHGPFVGHTGSVVGGTAAVILHVKSGVALALATNVGTVTAASPPAPPPGTPDPPQLLLPFLGR